MICFSEMFYLKKVFSIYVLPKCDIQNIINILLYSNGDATKCDVTFVSWRAISVTVTIGTKTWHIKHVTYWLSCKTSFWYFMTNVKSPWPHFVMFNLSQNGTYWRCSELHTSQLPRHVKTITTLSVVLRPRCIHILVTVPYRI